MKTYDFIGIGIGPFNLSIAALAGLDGFSSLFLERKPHFSAPGDDGAGLPYADQLPEGSGQRRRANQPPQLPELPVQRKSSTVSSPPSSAQCRARSLPTTCAGRRITSPTRLQPAGTAGQL